MLKCKQINFELDAKWIKSHVVCNVDFYLIHNLIIMASRLNKWLPERNYRAKCMLLRLTYMEYWCLLGLFQCSWFQADHEHRLTTPPGDLVNFQSLPWLRCSSWIVSFFIAVIFSLSNVITQSICQFGLCH